MVSCLYLRLLKGCDWSRRDWCKQRESVCADYSSNFQ